MNPLPNFADEIERLLRVENSAPRDQFLNQLLQEWAAVDAPSAVRYALTVDSPERREEFLHRLLPTWMRQDSTAALAWAEALPESSDRELAFTCICLELANRDPQQAVKSALDHRLDGDPGLMENLVGQWAATDLMAAYGWVKKRPFDGQREGLMARIAYVWSQTDPAAAARMVVNEFSAGNEQVEASLSVLHQWGLRDYQAASAWAALFPEGPLRERAMDELNAIARYRMAQ